MKLRDIKIGTRLALGFGSLLVIFIAAIFFSSLYLAKVKTDSRQVANESVPYALTAGQMAFDVVQVQQFLSDVSATHHQDGYKDAEDAATDFKAGLAKFREMFTREKDAKSLKDMDDLEAQFDKFYSEGKIMAGVYVSSGIDAGNKIMADFDKICTVLTKKMDDLKKSQVDEAYGNSRGVVTAIGRVQTVLIVMCLAAILIGIFVSYIITRSVTGPLNKAVHISNMLAEGDLTAEIEVNSFDEAGQMIRAMQNMIETLGKTILEIQSMSSSVASASEELSSSSEQMSKGSAEQAGRTAQVASASEQMAATVTDVAKNINDVTEAEKEANLAARKGEEIVKETLDGIMGIEKNVLSAAEVVTSLGRSSDEIGKVIKVIEDIADQTNLLALNAAIEAARAGEQGRGFAVVADEVRKLAEKTMRATKEISSTIVGIQKETKNAVESMEAGKAAVRTGTESAKKAGESISVILANSNRVSGMMQQIATSSEEQAAAVDNISKDVETIAQVTNETAAATNQISGAANSLATLAVRLNDAVSRFKVASAKAEAARTSRTQSAPRIFGHDAAVAGRAI